MDNLSKHQSVLGLGLILGIVLAAMSIVEKNNIDCVCVFLPRSQIHILI